MSTRFTFFGANRRCGWNHHPLAELGTDVVDLDSGDFPDVASSVVEDVHQYPAEGWWFHPQCRFAPQNVSLVDNFTNPDE